MGIAWHGSYALYFEDAREAFGRRYGLGYLDICREGYYVPLVDLEFHYRRPITYGLAPQITITFRPTAAAKLVFDYLIADPATGETLATGRSVQVFLDERRQLLWDAPAFFIKWKERWGIR